MLVVKRADKKKISCVIVVYIVYFVHIVRFDFRVAKLASVGLTNDAMFLSIFLIRSRGDNLKV